MPLVTMQEVSLVLATLLGLMVLYRAGHTIRVLKRFRNSWPGSRAGSAEDTISAVRDALDGHRVSVLVPAWNERSSLPLLMRDLAQLPFPNVEVLVRAGGDDGTLAEASELADSLGRGFRVFEQEAGEGKQRALKSLFAEASGDIVYLTDADCRMNASLFAATLYPLLFGDATAATTSPRPLDRQLEDPHGCPRLILALDAWVRHGKDSREITGGNVACWSSAVAASGAFDRPAPVGTDYAMALALTHHGSTIRFVRWPFVETDLATEPREVLHQLSRWTRNKWLHDRHVPVGAIVLTFAWWITPVVGAALHPQYAPVFAALMAMYLYAIHPGLQVRTAIFPSAKCGHLAFLRLALMVQAVPLIAYAHFLDSARRERW